MIPKSRYDSVDLYISQDWINRPEYNDNSLPINEPIYERLREHGMSETHIFCRFDKLINIMREGIDDLLSKHIAHLFIRDPLVIFSELIDQDDTKSMDHFEVCAIKAFLKCHLYNCPIRISNQQIGKQYALSPLRPIHLLAGELSLEAWKCN